jgi:hypothetical protein
MRCLAGCITSIAESSFQYTQVLSVSVRGFLRTADRVPRSVKSFTKLGPLFGIAWLVPCLRTEIGTAGIIPCSDLPQTSNNIIQKGLAFVRERSGSVTGPGARRASGSCPAGRMAKVGLWWWRRTTPHQRNGDPDAKAH